MSGEPSGDVTHSGERYVEGAATLRRRGIWLWHRYELVREGEVLAELGPRSWLWIYLGPGQRVTLQGGARGRIAARPRGRLITPVLIDDGRRVVARAMPGLGGAYAVNAAGGGYQLVPHETSTWRIRSNRWELRRHDLIVADMSLSPSRVVTAEPVPIAAVLLAFTVMALGIPGEEDLGLRNPGW